MNQLNLKNLLNFGNDAQSLTTGKRNHKRPTSKDVPEFFAAVLQGNRFASLTPPKLVRTPESGNVAINSGLKKRQSLHTVPINKPVSPKNIGSSPIVKHTNSEARDFTSLSDHHGNQIISKPESIPANEQQVSVDSNLKLVQSPTSKEPVNAAKIWDYARPNSNNLTDGVTNKSNVLSRSVGNSISGSVKNVEMTRDQANILNASVNAVPNRETDATISNILNRPYIARPGLFSNLEVLKGNNGFVSSHSIQGAPEIQLHHFRAENPVPDTVPRHASESPAIPHQQPEIRNVMRGSALQVNSNNGQNQHSQEYANRGSATTVEISNAGTEKSSSSGSDHNRSSRFDNLTSFSTKSKPNSKVTVERVVRTDINKKSIPGKQKNTSTQRTENLSFAKISPDLQAGTKVLKSKLSLGTPEIDEKVEKILNLKTLAQKIHAKAQLIKKDGVTVLEARLNPARLGSVRVLVEVHKEQMQLSFTAERHEAIAVLDGARSELVNILADHGYDLNQYSVEDESPYERWEQVNHDQEKQQRAHDHNNGDSVEEQGDDEQRSRTRKLSLGYNTLDLVA